eukprot:m51a1_g925 hypothetical protein (507) ;mRNA; f:201004-204403
MSAPPSSAADAPEVLPPKPGPTAFHHVLREYLDTEKVSGVCTVVCVHEQDQTASFSVSAEWLRNLHAYVAVVDHPRGGKLLYLNVPSSYFDLIYEFHLRGEAVFDSLFGRPPLTPRSCLKILGMANELMFLNYDLMLKQLGMFTAIALESSLKGFCSRPLESLLSDFGVKTKDAATPLDNNDLVFARFFADSVAPFLSWELNIQVFQEAKCMEDESLPLRAFSKKPLLSLAMMTKRCSFALLPLLRALRERSASMPQRRHILFLDIDGVLLKNPHKKRRPTGEDIVTNFSNTKGIMNSSRGLVCGVVRDGEQWVKELVWQVGELQTRLILQSAALFCDIVIVSLECPEICSAVGEILRHTLKVNIVVAHSTGASLAHDHPRALLSLWALLFLLLALLVLVLRRESLARLASYFVAWPLLSLILWFVFKTYKEVPHGMLLWSLAAWVTVSMLLGTAAVALNTADPSFDHPLVITDEDDDQAGRDDEDDIECGRQKADTSPAALEHTA